MPITSGDTVPERFIPNDGRSLDRASSLEHLLASVTQAFALEGTSLDSGPRLGNVPLKSIATSFAAEAPCEERCGARGQGPGVS